MEMDIDRRNPSSGTPEIAIVSRNFDGSERRRWKAKLMRTSLPIVELLGVFDRQVLHSDLGLIEKGTFSYEFYWLDRWYNVFRFHKPNGELRNFYCNINCPPIFDGETLEYVDLDIDVVWSEARGITILDEKEFVENCTRFSIPQPVQDQARKALGEVVERIEKRNFPFNQLG